MPPVAAAVLDTDVFSHLYVLRNSSDGRVAMWRGLLLSQRVLISFQTRAELLSGATMRQWAPKRLGDLREILDNTPTIRADDDVVDVYARLTADCRSSGHALGQKEHPGDRWVAACAVAKGVRLLAGDRVYESAPQVPLLG